MDNFRLWWIIIRAVIRIDGLLHIETSFIICRILEDIFPGWVAVLITISIGVAKEVYDRASGKGTAEWHDILCDIAGILLAVVMGLLA